MKLKTIKILNIKKIGKKKVYDISVEKNHNFFLSNNILSHNCLDVQSYNECRGLISGTEDYMLMFKTTSFRDREDMTEVFRREKRMRTDQINDLGFLNKGECYIAEANHRNIQKVKLILPRSDYWKKEYPNFYKSLWERRGGDWKMTSPLKEEIEQFYELNKDKYKEEIEKKKDKRKIKEPEELTPVTQVTSESNLPVSVVIEEEEFKPQSLLEFTGYN